MTLAEAEKNLGTISSLPQGWRWVCLGDVARVFAGSAAPQGKEYFDANGPPFVRVSDLGKYKRTTCLVNVQDRLSRKAIDECSLVLAQKGSILFPKSGAAIGTNNRAILGIDAYIVSHLMAVEPSSETTSLWLYWVLSQLDMTDFSDNIAYPSLKQSTVQNIKIPLPPLSEQKRITSAMNEKMAAVEKAHAAAEARLEAAKALPAAYLRAVFASEEAKEWPLIHLHETCHQIDYGYTASADFTLREPRFLRITDIQNGNVIWDTVPGCKISQSEEAAARLWDGDIVFARTGGTVGKSFLIKNPPRAVFASYLIRLRPEKDTIEPEYLYAFLQSDGYWRQLRMASRGGAQPNVNATLLGNLELPVPSVKKQQAMLLNLREQMNHVTKLTEVIEKELETINALPTALLRRAFRGGV